MFTPTTNATTIETTQVSLSSLKNEVFKTWFYADVDFIVDDTDYPLRAYEVMKKISIGLRAIAIMVADDIDAQKLWLSVRPYLKHMIDHGWEIRVGEQAGSLYIRIIDVENNSDDPTATFHIPPEGMRQIKNIDAWCSAMNSIQ